MHSNHPLWRPFDIGAAEELECRTYRNHYAILEMWLEQTHERLLFRCSQCNPDDLRPVLSYGICYVRIIKILYFSVYIELCLCICEDLLRVIQAKLCDPELHIKLVTMKEFGALIEKLIACMQFPFLVKLLHLFLTGNPIGSFEPASIHDLGIN